MANYTITEDVHVDIRVDGETIALDLPAGDHDLHPAVAELLTAQGVATPAVAAEPAKPAKKTTPKDTPIESTEA